MDDNISSPIRPPYDDELCEDTPAKRFVVVSPQKIKEIQMKMNLSTLKTTTSHLKTWTAWIESLPKGIFQLIILSNLTEYR